MSALVWETPTGGYAVPAGPERAPARRRHLAVVPAGPGEAAGASALRLTGRGRLVLTLVVVALAAVVGLVVLPGPSTSSSTTAPTRTVTVRPGQTLAEIAAHELPELSPGPAMTAIRMANQLNTTSVNAGETLVIPQS